tara:strand:+ start:3553 stop:3717 length:165 start_codon:yes stop_codon:yes gene_type:complete
MSQEPDTEPAPTRPSWKGLIVFVAVIVAIEASINWPKVSSFAHLPQIKHFLGIG